MEQGQASKLAKCVEGSRKQQGAVAETFSVLCGRYGGDMLRQLGTSAGIFSRSGL